MFRRRGFGAIACSLLVGSVGLAVVIVRGFEGDQPHGAAFNPKASGRADRAARSELELAAKRVHGRVEPMIQAGDAAVLPRLWVWLLEWLERRDESGPGSAFPSLAVGGIAEFGHRAMLPLFLELSRDQDLDRVARGTALHAVVMLAGEHEKPLLREVARDSEWLAVRCVAAAKLVRLGDDVGRDSLLKEFDSYLAVRKTDRGPFATNALRALEKLHDEKLIRALQERQAKEKDPKWRRHIGTLLERMAVNNAATAQLKEWAADTTQENATRRLWVIETLGARSTEEMIPFLESLKPWPHVKVEPGAVDLVKRDADKAIGHIRRRAWSASPQADVLPLAEFRGLAVARRPNVARWREIGDTLTRNKLSADAWAEYEKTKALLLEGKANAFLSRVLDNGDPCDARELQGLAELDGDLQSTRQTVRAVDELAPKSTTIQVAQEIPLFPKRREAARTAQVTFRLEGTSKIGARLAARHGRRTVADDDSVLVIMKRINGKWYWNPFGW